MNNFICGNNGRNRLLTEFFLDYCKILCNDKVLNKKNNVKWLMRDTISKDGVQLLKTLATSKMSILEVAHCMASLGGKLDCRVGGENGNFRGVGRLNLTYIILV